MRELPELRPFQTIQRRYKGVPNPAAKQFLEEFRANVKSGGLSPNSELNDKIHQQEWKKLSSVFKNYSGGNDLNSVASYISDKDTEFAVLFKMDKNKNLYASKVKAGTKSAVRLYPIKREELAGSTIIHNHPDGSNFSLDDIETAIRFRLNTFMAVTRNNKFIIQPQIPKGTNIDDLVSNIKKRYNELFLQMKNSGKTESEIMESLSKEFNLGYTEKQ